MVAVDSCEPSAPAAAVVAAVMEAVMEVLVELEAAVEAVVPTVEAKEIYRIGTVGSLSTRWAAGSFSCR